MADAITTSTAKPIPQGMTEAEFHAQEQQKAAAVRKDAAERLQRAQQQTTRAAQSAAITQKQPVFDTTKADSPLAAIKEHLSAVVLLARELPSSQELADFTSALMTAFRQLDVVEEAG